ncbi:PadR family transcriptional regulator [Nocardia jiangsuensis]|uniref:PadR family transcriptional regulator n=1 Tax=Nocardia jiangsuensis TaxID=1691563 RepID=A0ABV8DLN5_9NOCA
MPPRAARTPLTLAVLSLLAECPRHPYEMQALIRQRHVGDVVRLRGGSLYDAIARLDGIGLIEAVGSDRNGARPERTVYAITAAGRVQLTEQLREYLAEQAEEFPVFPAGLAHALHLPAPEVVALLRRRAAALTARIADVDADLGVATAAAVPRAVLLEAEYAQAVRRAELAWLDGIVTELESGALAWPELEEE